jgi:FkbM family methyltransferase
MPLSFDTAKQFCSYSVVILTAKAYAGCPVICLFGATRAKLIPYDCGKRCDAAAGEQFEEERYMRVKLIAARIAFRLWPFRALPRSTALFRGLPRGTILSRKLFGYRFSGDVTRNGPQRLLYLLGESFISEAALVRSLLRPGMRAVDVGANVGYYTLMIAQCIGPDGHIIAIEPSPENLPELKLNIRSNQISATVLPYAVSSHTRSGIRLRPGINSGIMEDDADADAIAYRVEQVTLDTVVTGSVDFVKLDIEGYEYRALLGAQKLLALGPTMFVEVHPIELRQKGSSARAVVELLSSNYPNVALYQQHQPSNIISKVLSSYGLNRIRQADRKALLDQCDAGTIVIPFWAVATTR